MGHDQTGASNHLTRPAARPAPSVPSVKLRWRPGWGPAQGTGHDARRILRGALLRPIANLLLGLAERRNDPELLLRLNATVLPDGRRLLAWVAIDQPVPSGSTGESHCVRSRDSARGQARAADRNCCGCSRNSLRQPREQKEKVRPCHSAVVTFPGSTAISQTGSMAIVAHSLNGPSPSQSTQSATSLIRWSCETITTPPPSSCAIRCSSRMTSWPILGSRLAVGSSARISAGSLTRARTIATAASRRPRAARGGRAAARRGRVRSAHSWPAGGPRRASRPPARPRGPYC